MEQVEFQDFSGGITDEYVDTAPNKYQRANNLWVTPNRKLKQAPGSYEYMLSGMAANLSEFGVRISAMHEFVDFQNGNSLLFSLGNGKLFKKTAAGSTEILSDFPSASQRCFAFGEGTFSTPFVSSYWNGHLLLTHYKAPDNASLAFERPVKVISETAGNFRLMVLGLPEPTLPTLTPNAAGANSYLYAVIYVRTYDSNGLEFVDFSSYSFERVTTTDPIGGGGSVTVGAVATPNTVAANQHYNTVAGYYEAWVYRTTAGGRVFYKVSENGFAGFTDTTTDANLQLAEPIYTSGGIVQNTQPPRCRFLHTVGDLTYFGQYEEAGGIVQNAILQSKPGDPDSAPGDFKIQVDDITINMSSYKGRPILFCARSAHRINGVIDELGSGDAIPTRISDNVGLYCPQSIVQTPMGIFFWGQDGVYYTDGYQVSKVSMGLEKSFQSWTNTSGKRMRIKGRYDTDREMVVWCFQQYQTSFTVDASVVTGETTISIPGGLPDGLKVGMTVTSDPSLTAAGSVTKLGANSVTYNSTNTGTGDTEVTFSSPEENDSFLHLHMRFGLSPSMCFTTRSGEDSFGPTDVIFYPTSGQATNSLENTKTMIRAQKRGYFLEHRDEYFNDIKIGFAGDPFQFGRQAIVYDFKSGSFSFGSVSAKKFIPKIDLIARNLTNLSLQINSLNDDGSIVRPLPPIRFRGNYSWGEEEIVWGDPTIIWNYDGLVRESRKFPAQNLRATYKQVQFTNALIMIDKSDISGLAEVDAGTKTVTLDAAPDFKDFPSDPVDYYIAFGNQEYQYLYKIIDYSGAPSVNEVTVDDPLDTLLGGPDQAWVIYGIKKNEIFELQAYTLHMTPISLTHKPYQGGNSGNASTGT